MRILHHNKDDMHVIITYDVHKKRCHKFMKFLRQWLEHRQRSVFAGFVTRRQLDLIKHGLEKLVHHNYDSVIIFESNRANQVGEWSTKAAEITRLSSVIQHSRYPSSPKQKTALPVTCPSLQAPVSPPLTHETLRFKTFKGRDVRRTQLSRTTYNGKQLSLNNTDEVE